MNKLLLVLASSNAGKLQEFQALFKRLSLELVVQSAYGVVDAKETGKSFVENALIKARHAAQYTGLPSLADDSGLVIEALDDAPGIYSARYAGTPTNAAANRQKVLSMMCNIPLEKRQAYFHCCLVLVRNADDPTPIICEARWHGSILTEEQGENGFGYDSIFFVPTHHCSAAELPLDIKNQISHRAQAMQNMLTQLASSD